MDKELKANNAFLWLMLSNENYFNCLLIKQNLFHIKCIQDTKATASEA